MDDDNTCLLYTSDVLGCPQLEYGTGKGSITLRSAVVTVVEGNRLIIDLGNGQLKMCIRDRVKPSQME